MQNTTKYSTSTKLSQAARGPAHSPQGMAPPRGRPSKKDRTASESWGSSQGSTWGVTFSIQRFSGVA